MVRLSDVINFGRYKESGKKRKPGEEVEKKQAESEVKKPDLSKEPKETSQIPEAASEKIELKKEAVDEETKLSLTRMMKSMEEEKKDARIVYKKGSLILKDIFEKADQKEHFDITAVTSFVREIVDEISVGKKELIELALIEDYSNYLWQHSLNTCILAVNVGLSLGYNRIKLNELGVSACLYDLGLVTIKDLINRPKKFSSDELAQVKKHPGIGVELLDELGKDIPDIIKEVTLQHHERVDGSGYPKGVKRDDIHEYSQIVGLLDHYESLTHARPHRETLPSHEAIKIIITKEAQSFNESLLKALIKKMSLYPIGSWVKLNTNEVGKVIETHEDFPLRPNVRVLFDSDGRRLDEIKTQDLSKNKNIYIEDVVDLGKLSTRISLK